MRDLAQDSVESLLIEVRAGTTDFARDIAAMRSTFDSTLLDGFARAGDVLERGLLGAIRRGSLGFSDLRRIALNTINEIAAQALQNLFAGLPGTGSGGIGGLLGFGSLIGSILGLPGRATGGLVSPGRGYVVGERGPELFVPAAAGRIDTLTPVGSGRGTREMKVSINIVSSRSESTPRSLQRSSRQIASAVRRAFAAS
ncbi:MAG: tail tape measure protein [Novosphingobium sp.]|nr:tail tape measure protein [Novosphingobium sp.]